LRPKRTPRLFAPLASFAGAGADQLALEFGQAAHDGEHQAAVRRGGVGPCVAERAEASFLVGDRCKRVQQVAGGSREPIKPSHQ
jgi:hypothetical protein